MQEGRAVGVEDSPFPGLASLPAHLASTHSPIPNTVYLCIPLLASVRLGVYIVCCVVTFELKWFCMSRFDFPGTPLKGKHAEMRSEGDVIQ